MRTTRPVDLLRVAAALGVLIERHAGRPCPSEREIAQGTGLSEHRVTEMLRAFRDNGVLLVEEEGEGPTRRRRLRIFCGEWTGWTAGRRGGGGEK